MIVIRYSVAIALLSALMISESLAQVGQHYFPSTIIVLPIRPHFAPSEAQCMEYRKKVAQVVSEAEDQHQECLESVQHGNNKTFAPNYFSNDTQSKCSKPECQRFHDLRNTIRKNGDKEISACYDDLRKEAQRKQEEKNSNLERRAREAQRDPCVRDQLAYENICTGRLETREQVARCDRELIRLRRTCPYRK